MQTYDVIVRVEATGSEEELDPLTGEQARDYVQEGLNCTKDSWDTVNARIVGWSCNPKP